MEQAPGILGWLDSSALGAAMRGSIWMYPIVEIVHIFGFVLVVGSVVMFDLRLLGLSASIPVRALAHHLLRWSVGGLLLVVPAGLMMFSAHPHDFISNKVFLVKLSLIAVAALNAAWFHLGIYRSVTAWDAHAAAPAAAKLHALLSIGLWIGVICCGRLLAYT